MHVEQNGTRISFELVGDGFPLVLLHGFGERAASWRWKSLVESLAGDRRLILVDARGHGASDKPHAPGAYCGDLLIGDVVAILDHLGAPQADVLGYSQGGWIALNLVALAPERVRRCVIGGATPYGQDLSVYRALASAGAERALGALERAAGFPFDQHTREAFLENDMEALKAAYTVDRPDISGALESFAAPCLLLCGDQDPLLSDMQRFSDDAPERRLLVMAGMNHVQAALRLNEVVPEIDTFLRSC